ncbi:MAG: DNA alkylation repair protein [Elusimicrobiota bacterium]
MFLGIQVPVLRKAVRKYTGIQESGIEELLDSPVHEHRFAGLLLLINRYSRADDRGRKGVVRFYLKKAVRVNNWDLVDLSAPKILGDFLVSRDRSILYKLAVSRNLWKKRISIVSTLALIRKNEYEDTLKLSRILLYDNHDLIHKAAGWMLREVGNRDMRAEENFLKAHADKMPRTMLRYAIEKFPRDKRQYYMKK